MTRRPTPILSLTRRQAYGIAVLAVILGAIGRIALDPIFHADLPLFLFIIPIILAGLAGGLRPGLLATALSLLLGDFLFMTPRGSIFHYEDPLDPLRVLIF